MLTFLDEIGIKLISLRKEDIMSKPIIGIITKPLTHKQCPDSLWVNDYIKDEFRSIVCDLGGIPIGILPCVKELVYNTEDNFAPDVLTDDDKANIIESIKLCDGIILQGGLTSDFYEVFIADYCIKNNIPILGICAGFNNIARAVGTDVEYDKELVFKHDIYDAEPHHFINIWKDGKILCNLLSEDTLFVNSIHSMTLSMSAVHLNKRIIIEAISKDSGMWGIPNVTVEAFSIQDTKFCLAVKWHPELLRTNSTTDAIFKAFMKACKSK